MVELTTEQQIEVLKQAKKELKNCYGLCGAIRNAHNRLFSENADSRLEPFEVIPLFTNENAVIACKKHKMKVPRIDGYRSFWWNTDTSSDRPRYTVINWLINELKKKL